MQLDRKVLAFLELPSSKGDLYTPDSGNRGFVHTAEIHNTGASDETVVLNYHDGTSEHQLYKLTVAADDTVILDFRGVGNVIDDGGKLTGNTTTATTVSIKLSGTEETPSAVGGGSFGSYVSLSGDYAYTEAATPVEEIMGQVTFDGAKVAGAVTISFVTVVTPTLTSGSCSVKLYDVGVVGTPAAARLVAQLSTSTSGGPQVLTQVLTTVASGASTNEINEANHVYEAAVTSSSGTGDTVSVGSARLEVF